MNHPEYKGVKCVEIIKEEPNSTSIEVIYFVPSDKGIRTFIDFGKRVEEFSLQDHVHNYGLRQRRIQIYNLSDIDIPPERLKKLEEAGLDKLLRQ